ncbi:hypothetical protein [Nannocystis bainbridge]|uniref:Uncharacterized protein n=1 Tax=Nannocystis bainbridge TaxID=2995303 RepID=A0ABT5EEF5_9BACT|nr:hypothetical protein [Nannocystis bainbridge]MDC0723211.1 hypothetical protein [Nannocystis bainbridge]
MAGNTHTPSNTSRAELRGEWPPIARAPSNAARLNNTASNTRAPSCAASDSRANTRAPNNTRAPSNTASNTPGTEQRREQHPGPSCAE